MVCVCAVSGWREREGEKERRREGGREGERKGEKKAREKERERERVRAKRLGESGIEYRVYFRKAIL